VSDTEHINQTIEEQFMADTTLERNPTTPFAQGTPPPVPEKPVAPGTKIIPLSDPELLPDQTVNFLELIELRATVRQYSDVPLTFKELSYLLWCTQGVKMGLPNCGSARNVPSAGGRHAFETYLYIQHVQGLHPGLYRYLAFEHALLPLTADEAAGEQFRSAFRAKNMTANNAVTFVWAAVLERMTNRFGTRAYRYLFLDAGHVCQNLYLAAQTIKTGVCAIGAFSDDKLNQALGLDGKAEFAVYAASVGRI
jgi:SagB-type dehydrogenase family enzyme